VQREVLTVTVTVALALTSRNLTPLRQPSTLELKERPSKTCEASVLTEPAVASLSR
jgi:hypothetical protein